jgi:endogenous inhibitor of DNA gyrase (YacG/DUF329 family)
MISFICPTCNKSFELIAYKARRNKGYCSLQCAGMAHRGPGNPNWKGGITKRPPMAKGIAQKRVKIIGHCERCGSIENLHGHHILHYSSSPLFGHSKDNIEVLCSICHSKEHPEIATLIRRPIVKTGITSKCEICGILVYSFPSRLHRFCSSKCRLKWLDSRPGATGPERKGTATQCKICGKKIYLYPCQIGQIRCCGPTCSKKWRQRLGQKVPCKACGKSMHLAPTRIGKVHFCSPQCRRSFTGANA